MDNHEIRQRIKNSGLKHWQVAAGMGISEATLVRWLRAKEIPLEHQQMILNELEKTGRSGNDDKP